MRASQELALTRPATASQDADVIVVGAGSAGCVLANRLSADPARRVLVLEAGGKDDWIWFHIPVGYLFSIGNPRADWMFETDPIPGLAGRSLRYPRGKVIGGCSAINAMIYMRGQAADYDGWRQMGLAGWGWDEVLPLFLAQEDHVAPPNEHHRQGGAWRVEHPRMRWRVLDAFAEAAEMAGVARVADFNTGDNAGSGYFQVNQKAGLRWSAARGFLKPALGRPNLRLETGAHVERLLIEDGRCVGVRWSRDGETFESRARDGVVVATGAVGTPQLLELSGVGDGERLAALGVETLRHLPGVGENLQDHLQIRPIYEVSGVPTMNALYKSWWRRPLMALEYAARRTGPMSMAPSQMGAFARSSPDYATPNLQFHVQPLSLEKFGDPLHAFPAITISVCNLRPTSRGGVHATSPDSRAAPSIQPNYLATAEDQRVAVESLRLVRRIADQAPLKAYGARERAPSAAALTDEDILASARQLGTTIFHPAGTAKMGLATDPQAVVDARLRVRGIEGLRIADASVMPTITSGNTNSPTMMIAEKAARMIAEDGRV
ncbi:GMC family oxidoreductase [Phenylobacterium sp.]|uniref:GMC family oxidoreductase n=1 Tax=Phenylobacterium sp. TaxID=1871053 RepID=UPI0025D3874B|nr:GMC family oxidoreductase N-terminal domain-containing protein [Phenylobacterium sp.]